MPATTPTYKLPYPLGTDRVADGDDAIRKLAQTVEYAFQSGTINVNVTSGGTAASAVLTFPVPFTAPPTVVVTAAGTNPVNVSASVAPGTTNTQATIYGVRATPGNQVVNWFAVGPVGPVALLAAEPEQQAEQPPQPESEPTT